MVRSQEADVISILTTDTTTESNNYRRNITSNIMNKRCYVETLNKVVWLLQVMDFEPPFVFLTR